MALAFGARFIAAPQINPFSFASTMIPPIPPSPTASSSANSTPPSSSSSPADFSRGNSFFYGVQGCNDNLQSTPPVLKEVLKVLEAKTKFFKPNEIIIYPVSLPSLARNDNLVNSDIKINNNFLPEDSFVVMGSLMVKQFIESESPDTNILHVKLFDNIENNLKSLKERVETLLVSTDGQRLIVNLETNEKTEIQLIAKVVTDGHLLAKYIKKSRVLNITMKIS
jgi:hypothetical protein